MRIWRWRSTFNGLTIAPPKNWRFLLQALAELLLWMKTIAAVTGYWVSFTNGLISTIGPNSTPRGASLSILAMPCVQCTGPRCCVTSAEPTKRSNGPAGRCCSIPIIQTGTGVPTLTCCMMPGATARRWTPIAVSWSAPPSTMLMLQPATRGSVMYTRRMSTLNWLSRQSPISLSQRGGNGWPTRTMPIVSVSSTDCEVRGCRTRLRVTDTSTIRVFVLSERPLGGAFLPAASDTISVTGRPLTWWQLSAQADTSIGSEEAASGSQPTFSACSAAPPRPSSAQSGRPASKSMDFKRPANNVGP